MIETGALSSSASCRAGRLPASQDEYVAAIGAALLMRLGGCVPTPPVCLFIYVFIHSFIHVFIYLAGEIRKIELLFTVHFICSFVPQNTEW